MFQKTRSVTTSLPRDTPITENKIQLCLSILKLRSFIVNYIKNELNKCKAGIWYNRAIRNHAWRAHFYSDNARRLSVWYIIVTNPLKRTLSFASMLVVRTQLDLFESWARGVSIIRQSHDQFPYKPSQGAFTVRLEWTLHIMLGIGANCRDFHTDHCTSTRSRKCGYYPIVFLAHSDNMTKQNQAWKSCPYRYSRYFRY